MNNQFKQSGKGRLTYLPQYNHDDSKTEATIIEVKPVKPQKRRNNKIDKSKVISLIFRAIYLIMFVATLVMLYHDTNGQFIFAESYMEILNSQHTVGGSAIMYVFVIIMERLVVFYVENFMD
jgi:hypothetical protein